MVDKNELFKTNHLKGETELIQITIFRHQNLTMPKFPNYLQPDAGDCNSGFMFELVNFGQHQNIKK